MSLADDLFIQNCRDILENGVSDEGCEVRPRWGRTGTPAPYYKEVLYRQPVRPPEGVSADDAAPGVLPLRH